ncbi:MAG: sugar phosphate isomerase/epimerase [Chloroflexi bacterium]|nr:sugar phosphate isomerase/epimerase [Ardenticatenaceae bacterium]MBL1128063.1 sugar phosphate isomerase/epimerase [Chloroflexota bacterium]NOG34134.1 sugar phosphate isomerase/epimerase [Chloroflexota bacterium]GIK56867.1 MAG: isomerase [Chloroflexota bacterium]
MKIGINTWVWTAPLTTERLEKLLPCIAEMGFDWIEFPLEGIGDFHYGRAAELVRDYGLGVSTCAAMGPDRDLVHPDTAVQKSGLAYIQQAIKATQAIGATNLVGPIYSAVGRTWQATADERARDLDTLARHLRSLAAYAADHGVVLGIEPLNRFETSFINTHEQAIELIDRVDHPACRIMLDTFHMNIEEKSIGAAIRVTGKRLCHLHACENDRGVPGSGHVPWNEVAGALHDIGYDGPVVIESFTAEVQSIAKAAAIWRKLAPSQDALAAEGLAFLQALLG